MLIDNTVFQEAKTQHAEHYILFMYKKHTNLSPLFSTNSLNIQHNHCEEKMEKIMVKHRKKQSINR